MTLSNRVNYQSTKLRDLVCRITKEKKITKWDLGGSLSEDLSVQVDQGEAKQLKGSQRSVVTIRIWNSKGLLGLTTTTDISESGIKKAIDAAYDASDYCNAHEIPDFSPFAKLSLKDQVERTSEKLGIKSLFRIIKKAEQELLGTHESINSVPYNGLAQSEYERFYINSDGAFRANRSLISSIYLYAKAQELDRKPRSAGAIRIAYQAKDLDVQGCIKEAADKSIDHLNYEKIKTDKYLICFTPNAILQLIGAFSNIFNARSIIDGVSLSTKESIGEKIASSLLNIYDDARNKYNIGGPLFDGEGTPTSRLCLIENGHLKNLMHSEATARVFDMSPTGHAGLGAKASVGLNWLVINKSKDINNDKELNHVTYRGEYILIDELNALHAGIKASQGSFSLPFDGWIVNNVEKKSIESATVAGDIREVLNDILSIEEKTIITHQGEAPYLWINKLKITGEL